MKKLTILAAVSALALSTACTRHRVIDRTVTINEPAPTPNDGLNGLHFDYTRGIDGAVAFDAASPWGLLLIDARHVVPQHILDAAPAERPDAREWEGLTLTFGAEDSTVRVFLVRAYPTACVYENGPKWTVTHQLEFEETGWMAIVEPTYLARRLVDGPVEMSQGHLVRLDGQQRIRYFAPNWVGIGRSVRINIGD